MIAPPFRIAVIGLSFTVPHFYFRDEEIRDAYNRPATRPLFSPEAREAHRFFQEQAVIRIRDDFRRIFPKQRVYVETVGGFGPLFEDRGAQPKIDTKDTRKPLYVEPDGFENTGNVFVLKPAVTPTHGRCWCLRAIDVPSLAQFHTALETVYNSDPIECVRQAQERWAQFNPQPFRPPELEARETEELRSFVQEIKNQRRAGLRPGDR
jgi:hypothetical protein